MKKISIGSYSNDSESFKITKIESNKVYLETETGINFLRANKNSKVEISKRSLENFFNEEMIRFKKI